MNSKHLITALVLLAGPLALAGPLQLQQVDASANWLVHLDMDQLRASQFGQLAREEIRSQNLESKLAAVAQIFSFHPIDDISDVTLYGQGPNKDLAVLILQGNFDPQALLALLQANASYEQIPHANRTVHSWIAEKGPDAGQRKFGIFYGEDLIAMGNTLETLQQATAVLDDTAPNCAALDPFALAEQDRSGAIVTLAAVGISEMALDRTRTPLLREVDRLSVMLGETEGLCYAHLICDAKDAQAALQINQIVQGMLAYGALAQDKCPALAVLASATRCYLTEKRVELIFEYNAPEAFAALKEVALKMHERRHQKQEEPPQQ